MSTKHSKGIWKKERAVGRKYSHSDAHPAPRAHTRSKYWVGAYTTRTGRHVAGHWHTNPFYRRAR